MNPDMVNKLHEMGLNPKVSTRPPGQNPYSAARAKRAAPAGAVVPAQPDMGQVQPDFANPSLSLETMNPQDPSMPSPLIGMPSMHPGQPGSEDLRTDKYNRDLQRGKTANVYQDPHSYDTHQNTVMNSPLMKKMAEGLDQERQLREQYLQNAANQEDLSPTMALADFLAKGKGTAQAGYRRPMNYDETVANIRGMLEGEQKSRGTMAQMALEQTGGLKSGQEEAQAKTSADLGREQGYKIPHPMMGGLMMPFNQANQFSKNYEANPGVKEINDEIANANKMEQLLANPNWYTNRALAGSAVKQMGFNKMTQAEFFTLGGGSQDLWNRASNLVRTGYNGQTLSPSDIQTIQDFSTIRKRAALAKREQIHQSYQQGLGSAMMNPGAAPGLMNQGDVQPDNSSGSTASERANAVADRIAEKMRSMK